MPLLTDASIHQRQTLWLSCGIDIIPILACGQFVGGGLQVTRAQVHPERSRGQTLLLSALSSPSKVLASRLVLS